MKRSEAVRLVHDLLKPSVGLLLAEEVLTRLEGPLSIDYDPEEEPLPERLSLDPFGEPSVPMERSVSGRYLTVREKREAVRRWNAQERLRKHLTPAATIQCAPCHLFAKRCWVGARSPQRTLGAWCGRTSWVDLRTTSTTAPSGTRSKARPVSATRLTPCSTSSLATASPPFGTSGRSP